MFDTTIRIIDNSPAYREGIIKHALFLDKKSRDKTFDRLAYDTTYKGCWSVVRRLPNWFLEMCFKERQNERKGLLADLEYRYQTELLQYFDVQHEWKGVKEEDLARFQEEFTFIVEK